MSFPNWQTLFVSTRGLFVSIEGPDPSVNKLLTEHLQLHAKNSVYAPNRYNDSRSTIGDLLNTSIYGRLELQDLVFYNLRNASFWEHQSAMRINCFNGTTIVTNNYVFTNRAILLSKGNVSTEICPQLDAGLIKPDIQFYVKSDTPDHCQVPSRFHRDTEESRALLTEAFINLSDTYKNLYIIENRPSNILDAAEQLVNKYDKVKSRLSHHLSYFNGIE